MTREDYALVAKLFARANYLSKRDKSMLIEDFCVLAKEAERGIGYGDGGNGLFNAERFSLDCYADEEMGS